MNSFLTSHHFMNKMSHDNLAHYQEHIHHNVHTRHVKPTNINSYNFVYTFNEEPISSPSSTQCYLEDSEAPESSQASSPNYKRRHSKTSTDCTSINAIEDSSEECMSPGESDEGQNIVKLDEKKESMLKRLALRYKYDWKKVANKFNKVYKVKMAPADLKYTYKHLPKPNMSMRVKFTHEEDLMIAKLFDQFGCDWAHIATYFPTRTATMLKNRYYSFIRKNDLLTDMLAEVKDSQEEELSQEKSPKAKINSGFNEILSESSELISKDRVKNLFEDYSEISINRQMFDMESCLVSELNVKVASNNYSIY